MDTHDEPGSPVQPANGAGPRETWDVLPPVQRCVTTEVPEEEEDTWDKGS